MDGGARYGWIKRKDEFKSQAQSVVVKMLRRELVPHANGYGEVAGDTIARTFFGRTIFVSWWLGAPGGDALARPWRLRASLFALGGQGAPEDSIPEIHETELIGAGCGLSQEVNAALRACCSRLFQRMREESMVGPYQALRESGVIEASCAEIRPGSDSKACARL